MAAEDQNGKEKEDVAGREGEIHWVSKKSEPGVNYGLWFWLMAKWS